LRTYIISSTGIIYEENILSNNHTIPIIEYSLVLSIDPPVREVLLVRWKRFNEQARLGALTLVCSRHSALPKNLFGEKVGEGRHFGGQERTCP